MREFGQHPEGICIVLGEYLMLKIRALLTVAVTILLSGCAGSQSGSQPENQYSKFYKPYTVTPYVTNAPFTGTPQVVSSSGDLKADSLKLYIDGYGPIGRSAFDGKLEAQDDALKQAIALHASHVIVQSKYPATQSGATSLTTPATTPDSVQRYDQVATFFAPIARSGLGIFLDDLPDNQRQQIGSSNGFLVTAVRRESPASGANILPGDVLLSIDGSTIASYSDVARLIKSGTGRIEKIGIWRSGERKTIDVNVPASW